MYILTYVLNTYVINLPAEMMVIAHTHLYYAHSYVVRATNYRYMYIHTDYQKCI